MYQFSSLGLELTKQPLPSCAMGYVVWARKIEPVNQDVVRTDPRYRKRVDPALTHERMGSWDHRPLEGMHNE